MMTNRRKRLALRRHLTQTSPSCAAEEAPQATNPILYLLLRLSMNRLPNVIVHPLLCPITSDSEGIVRAVLGGEDGHLTLRPLSEEEDTDVEASKKGAYASYVQVIPRSCSIELQGESSGSKPWVGS